MDKFENYLNEQIEILEERWEELKTESMRELERLTAFDSYHHGAVRLTEAEKLTSCAAEIKKLYDVRRVYRYFLEHQDV